jgi:hypothetical protein
MRDFRAGGNINVVGDVNIIDNSEQLKLLVQCTNDELFEERKHRTNLLKNEKKRKYKKSGIFFISVIIISILVSIGIYLAGNSDLASFVLGGGGLVASAASIKISTNPSEFEMRQAAALNEIRMILRERGGE